MSCTQFGDIKGFYDRNEVLIWTIGIAIPLVILGIGLLAAPHLFWDEFAWRYYIAPIVADAQDHSIDGITESYNVVDTLTYGSVLVVVVMAIYRLFKRMGVPPGKDMVFAIVPYILLGGVLRSLEDSGMFTGMDVYLFIAPIIYVFIGMVTIIKVLESHHLERVYKKGGKKGAFGAMVRFGGIHVIWNILYSIIYYLYMNERGLFSDTEPSLVYMLNPAVSVVLSLCAFLGLWILVERRGRLYTHDCLGVFGWHFLALAFFHALAFVSMGGRWQSRAPGADMNIYYLIWVPLIAIAATGVIAGVSWALSGRFKALRIFWTRPVNLLIMLAHMFDASATFTALQFFDYGEKHVLPNFLIQATGTPAVMFPLKAIVIGAVIYVLDIELKKDLSAKDLLRTVVWIAILVLGLAPGTRDVMRLALGV